MSLNRQSRSFIDLIDDVSTEAQNGRLDRKTRQHNLPQRKAVRPQDTRAPAVGESLGNGNLREAGGGPGFSIGQPDMPGARECGFEMGHGQHREKTAS